MDRQEGGRWGPVCRALVMLVAGAVGMASTVDAAVINRALTVQVGQGTFHDLGSYIEWEYYASVTPFTLNAGDTIITTALFDRPILLTDIGNGALQVGPFTSRETLSFRYGLADPTAHFHGTWESTIHLDALLDVNADSSHIDASGGGREIEFMYFFIEDLTSGTAALRGFQLVTHLDTYSVQGLPDFNYFFLGLSAGAISIPEPSSSLLVVIGALAGVGTATRQRRRGFEPQWTGTWKWHQ